MTEHCEALNNGDSWNFSNERNPRCPHCGETYDINENESWDLYGDDDTENDIECKSCEKPFRVYTRIEYRFCTDEQPEPDEYAV